jgi:hypothetical protein
MFNLKDFKFFYSEYILGFNEEEIVYLYDVFKFSPKNFCIENSTREILRLRNVKVPDSFMKKYVLN